MNLNSGRQSAFLGLDNRERVKAILGINFIACLINNTCLCPDSNNRVLYFRRFVLEGAALMTTDISNFGRRIASIEGTRIWGFGLGICTLLFLFSGFYKGLFWSPVDLTVLFAAATVLLLLYIRSSEILRQPAVWILTSLLLYLAIRTVPAPTSWGIRKLLETFTFGTVGLAAGYAAARRHDVLELLLDILSYSTIPMIAILTVSCARGDPFEFQGLGSAGYQVTAAYFSFALFASLISDRWIYAGLALFGLCLAGNVSAAIFAPIAIFALLLKRAVPARIILRAVALTVVLSAAYSFTISPPLLVMRAIWKIGGLEAKLNLEHHPTLAPPPLRHPTDGAASSTAIDPNTAPNAAPTEKAPISEAILSALPNSMRSEVEIQVEAADRLDIYRSAWGSFLASPIFGNGYGKLTYTVHNYPHNIVLELLAEGGIIAGILLMLSLFFCWPTQAGDSSSFATAVLIVIVGTAMFSGYFGSRLLMFALGLGIGAKSIKLLPPQ